MALLLTDPFWAARRGTIALFILGLILLFYVNVNR